jgi:serine/threonine protein kinase
MICCLNPDCNNPSCQDSESFCSSCGISLVVLNNRYQPLKSIGAGGFGKTYLARDLECDRFCAIKQFAPQTTNEWAIAKAKELFEREAIGLQKLGVHPQIPSLLDYFETEGNLYLIQEYIEGETLKDELNAEGIFDEEKIRQVLGELLDILAFVHQYGIIHRDIKPQNIMRRSGDRKLILIDFGVSKQMTLSAIGKPATRIGSSGYVPREQIDTGDVSSNCDLYSVGATCFHLLTGIHPRQLVQQESYYWVQNWRKHLGDRSIDKKLSFIFDRLLQVESRRRYQLVEEVLADFRKLDGVKLDKIRSQTPTNSYSGDDITAIAPDCTPPTVITEGDRQIIKRRSLDRILDRWQDKLSHPLLKFIGGVALALLSLLGTQFYNYSRYRLFPSNPLYIAIAPPSEVFLQHTLKNNGGGIVSLSIDDRRNLFGGSSNGAIEQWDLTEKKLVKTLKTGGNRILAIATDRQNKILVSGDAKGKVTVWDIASGKENSSFEIASGKIVALALDNDCKQAIVAIADAKNTNRIEIWDTTEGAIVSTMPDRSNDILSLAVSQDGRVLVTGGIDRSLKIWNLQTKKLEKTLSSHTGYIEAIAITPDNRILVSGSADRTIKIWDLQTGELRQTLIGHDEMVKSVAIDPNGEILVSAGVDRQIRFWRMKTGKSIAIYLGHGNSINSLTISPDGKTLASGSIDGTIELWQMPF